MPLHRRALFAGLGAGLSATLLPAFRADAGAALAEASRSAGDRTPSELAGEEAYWSQIARAFDVDRTLVNLNNGGCSPAPAHVLEAMIRDLRFSNEMPVYHMWNVLEPRIESARRELAAEFGCDLEEMAIVRNASEALETLILGIDLKAGDEVVVTNQNYPRMITTWKQRERRDGIVLKQISFPVPPPSSADVVERFRQAITPRTRVIEVTHITNLTGQILPVRDIVAMARPKGIEVFVDGAHAFAHFPFRRDQLDCDYYGTSLHKWLTAPIGTGFLYVRKEKIPGIWPMMAAPPEMNGNIRKFEEIGTHPAANHNAVSEAVTFYQQIGAERKAARLRFLRDRWFQRLGPLPGVKILTSTDPAQGCGLASFTPGTLDVGKVVGYLWDKHRIIVTPINHPEFHCIRVTPNVYTTLAEVDRFNDAMETVMKKGLPA